MKRNPYLRVKLKSLAEEARIIRIEEERANKARDYHLQNSLHLHRVTTVRQAARETLLAYNYLRGMRYDQCEQKGSSSVNWSKVATMVKRYGHRLHFDYDAWIKGETLKEAA